MADKYGTCEVNVERSGFLGRKRKVTISKDCSDEKVKAILKKRNIKLNDVNLIKKE